MFFVIIGDKWHSFFQKARHNENQRDFVELEIECALRHKKKIVPILIDDSTMPQQNELPVAIQPIAFINAMQFRNNRFSDDFNELLRITGLITNRAIEAKTQQPSNYDIPSTEKKKPGIISKDILFLGYGFGSRRWFDNYYWNLDIKFDLFFDSEWDYKLYETRIDFYIGYTPIVDKNSIVWHYVKRDEIAHYASGTCRIIVEKGEILIWK